MRGSNDLGVTLLLLFWRYKTATCVGKQNLNDLTLILAIIIHRSIFTSSTP